MTPTLIIITLILFGIIAILAEFLIIPGLGVAGILGLASLVASSVYAFNQMGSRIGTIVTAVDIVIVVLMLIIMLKARTWKRFELKDSVDASVEDDSKNVHEGQRGKTITRIAPVGTARFREITCEVRSYDGTLIDPSVEVEVVRIDNNQIFVRPINN